MLCLSIKKTGKKGLKKPEPISDYSKAAEYKVNKQKSIAFLHTSNEQVGFKIKKCSTIYIIIKNEIFRYQFNKIYIRFIGGKL